MLSAVLKSETAILVSIRIMDAFVAMRRTLASLAPLLSRIEATERRQLKQEDAQARNEERFKLILDAMQQTYKGAGFYFIAFPEMFNTTLEMAKGEKRDFHYVLEVAKESTGEKR